MGERGQGRQYRGGVSCMKAHSDWLGAQDLAEARQVDIRIKDVLEYPAGSKLAGRQTQQAFYSIVHEVPGDGDEWLDAPKEWKLNTTNARVLWLRFGPHVESWIGKVVTLFIEPVRSPTGGQVMGIRIRSTPEERDEKMMYRQMRRAASPEDPRNEAEIADSHKREPGDDDPDEGGG